MKSISLFAYRGVPRVFQGGITMTIALIIISVLFVINLGIIVAESTKNDKLDKDNAELRAAEQTSKATIDNLTAENTSLKKDISSEHAKATNLSAMLESEREAGHKLKTQLHELTLANGELDNVNYQIEKAKTELELAKSEQASVEAAVHSAETKIELAEAKLFDINDQIEEKERSLHELEARLMSRSQLERSDEDTDKMQAEIEVINAQVEACKKTADLAEKIGWTISSYSGSSSHDRLCEANSSLISCIIIGFHNDGNISFAYPIVNYYDIRDFENNCTKCFSNPPSRTAYGIALRDADGEKEQERLQTDILSHQNLERIVILTDNPSTLSVDNGGFSFKKRNLHFNCNCEVVIVRHSDESKTWSPICGWIKSNEAKQNAENLTARLNQKQHDLEQTVAAKSQLFMADALLNPTDSQQN